MRLKQAIYESTRAPLTRSPFPNGEGKSVAASPRSRAQVAVVLAFVISHTTFLATQDDEMGRCAPPLSQTIKGCPAQGLTLYLTSHLCYAIGNSEPLTIHDFQETRSFL